MDPVQGYATRLEKTLKSSHLALKDSVTHFQEI